MHENLRSLLHSSRTLLLREKNKLQFFKLSDLVTLYTNRLTQLTTCVHSTKIKEQILAMFPELQAFKEGRDVLLMSNDDVGIALRQACENDTDDDDAYVLARAA